MYQTLSRQVDLESAYALCKIFGLILLPLTLLCILFGFIGLFNGDIGTFLAPTLMVTFGTVLTLLPTGIIMTSDNLRAYSGHKIFSDIDSVFQCFKVPYHFLKKILESLRNNQIHTIEE